MGRAFDSPSHVDEELIDWIKLLRSGEENWLRHDRRRYREIMTKVDEQAVGDFFQYLICKRQL
jgi:hypothetical protein